MMAESRGKLSSVNIDAQGLQNQHNSQHYGPPATPRKVPETNIFTQNLSLLERQPPQQKKHAIALSID